MLVPSAEELTIDRIAPTIRPPGRHIMVQNWHHLLFLHWEVDGDHLQSLLPPGLSLDTFDGKAYVGLLPFTMTGVKPVGVPDFPPLTNFHEMNVRTYVHYKERDPGVFFFSLDAANAAAVLAARISYKLPYFHAAMRFRLERRPDNRQTAIHFLSRRLWPDPLPARCQVHYGPTGGVALAQPGSLESFLVERYVLYSHWYGKLFRARVHHRPYPLQAAWVDRLHESAVAAAGIRVPFGDQPLMHYSRGVHVLVYPLEAVDNAYKLQE